MNFPGSAIGACSRTEDRAWATGWNLPPRAASIMAVSMSWLALPPSRKPRVLSCGKSAAAMIGARTTPRDARNAAALASRSAMRSLPRKQPSRGA